MNETETTPVDETTTETPTEAPQTPTETPTEAPQTPTETTQTTDTTTDPTTDPPPADTDTSEIVEILQDIQVLLENLQILGSDLLHVFTDLSMFAIGAIVAAVAFKTFIEVGTRW